MFRGRKNRLGLCCTFRDQDIKFKTRQAVYLAKFTRTEQLDLLSTTIMHNASSLMRALEYCDAHNIGCFRINSKMLPLKTHPEVGYTMDEIPDLRLILQLFEASRSFGRSRNIRTTFHPDQFTLLSSPSDRVTRQSLQELEYHAYLASLVGADTIILHGGGAYGKKAETLTRLTERIQQLPAPIRDKLALENDDRVYTPADLLPVCEKTGIPLVYDVHHHRCLPDTLGIEEATVRAAATWNREPLFHLSSPKLGWQGREVRSHHDYIEISDLPALWLDMELTIEIEAKAKELAVASLQKEMDSIRRAA